VSTDHFKILSAPVAAGSLNSGALPRLSAIGAWSELRSLTSGALPRLSAMAGPQDDDGGPGSVVVTEKQVQTKAPSFYKVILLNDDFTPMDFVVHILQKFFAKTSEEAQTIMLQVHQDGAGVAGIFTYEIGETKVFLVNQYAKQHKYPLKSVLEKA